MGQGSIAILDEPKPTCPAGGLLVRTEASGLCSGELMDWYMDQKIPHVLGHEVSGIIEESDDPRFPAGRRVFVHHHAPCLKCEMCLKKLFVHCARWKRTKLEPGGMAEYFAASAENLNDAFLVDDLRAEDAALIEPLACVVKSLSCALTGDSAAIIGAGSMGLMHALIIKSQNLYGQCDLYDLSADRIAIAHGLGLSATTPANTKPADVVFVLPGNKAALDLAVSIVNPGGMIVLFAPMQPGEETRIDLNKLYFKDITIRNSYSCGPEDTKKAYELLQKGEVMATQVITEFVKIDELPDSYRKMKNGEILKAMVTF